MALTLTSDPIMSLEDALRFLNSTDDDLLTLTINAVSAKFLEFTCREVINRAAADPDLLTVDVRAENGQVIWLPASPLLVGESNDIEVETWIGGQLAQTYKYSDDEIVYKSSETYASISPVSFAFPVSRDRSTWTRIKFYGGWTSVPGDVTAGAIAQALIEIKRLGGLVGMDSVSRKSENVQYDRDGVIVEAAQAWNPYVV